jgi:hypothetical protein
LAVLARFTVQDKQLALVGVVLAAGLQYAVAISVTQ